jgi:hypothetical protein
MKISRTAINRVVIGAAIGAILGGILAYSIVDPPIVSSDIIPVTIAVFAFAGAVFGGIIHRGAIHEARRAEKAGREPMGAGMLALVLFLGIGLSLLARMFLPAGIFGILALIVGVLSFFSRKE